MRTSEGYPGTSGRMLPSGSRVERHLDQRRVGDHGFEVLTVPCGLDDLAHHAPPLVGVLDDPCRGGKVSARSALDVEGETRVGVKVGEPAPALSPRLAADVDAAVDDVVDDLDAAGLPAPPSSGGDVDHVPAREYSLHRVRNGCHDNYHTPGRLGSSRGLAIGPARAVDWPPE